MAGKACLGLLGRKVGLGKARFVLGRGLDQEEAGIQGGLAALPSPMDRGADFEGSFEGGMQSVPGRSEGEVGAARHSVEGEFVCLLDMEEAGMLFADREKGQAPVVWVGFVGTGK